MLAGMCLLSMEVLQLCNTLTDWVTQLLPAVNSCWLVQSKPYESMWLCKADATNHFSSLLSKIWNWLTPHLFILLKFYLPVDRTPPVASCPADIVREVSLSQTRIQVFFTAPTATDNSGQVPTITSQTHATTDFFNLGNTQVTWAFSDASGNQDSCTFNVNIVQGQYYWNNAYLS